MQSKTIETVEQERSLLVTPHPRGAGCFIYSTDVGNSIILAPEHVRALIEALRPYSEPVAADDGQPRRRWLNAGNPIVPEAAASQGDLSAAIAEVEAHYDWRLQATNERIEAPELASREAAALQEQANERDLSVRRDHELRLEMLELETIALKLRVEAVEKGAHDRNAAPADSSSWTGQAPGAGYHPGGAGVGQVSVDGAAFMAGVADAVTPKAPNLRSWVFGGDAA